MVRLPWSNSNPDGDLVPILQASIDAAKKRHPSGKAADDVNATVTDESPAAPLDRCDACPAAASYRMHKYQPGKPVLALDMCGHHWRKNAPAMFDEGWLVISGDPAYEFGDA